ncbi:MAG: proteasome assembly chaperone 4 family protein [Candidatus Thorarchaeota archaeon]|jgi:hypothetical protein
MMFEKQAGRHKIYIHTEAIGSDLLVSVYGGDEHHIGGVSVAFPTKSHYRDAITTSVNSITLPGHKDYIVSNSTAERICKTLEIPVVVTVGIHYDAASSDEITEIVQTVDELVGDVISHYQNAE